MLSPISLLEGIYLREGVVWKMLVFQKLFDLMRDTMNSDMLELGNWYQAKLYMENT